MLLVDPLWPGAAQRMAAVVFACTQSVPHPELPLPCCSADALLQRPRSGIPDLQATLLVHQP